MRHQDRGLQEVTECNVCLTSCKSSVRACCWRFFQHCFVCSTSKCIVHFNVTNRLLVLRSKAPLRATPSRHHGLFNPRTVHSTHCLPRVAFVCFHCEVLLLVMVSNTHANGHGPGQGSPETNGSMHVGGDQYLPRSILITGGAGFIASHVVTQLLDSHPQYKVRS